MTVNSHNNADNRSHGKKNTSPAPQLFTVANFIPAQPISQNTEILQTLPKPGHSPELPSEPQPAT